MFEEIFKCPDTISDYRLSPMAEERLRYLCHCKQHGAPRFTLRTIASNQLYVVRYLGLADGARPIDRSQVEAAAYQWAKPRPHRRYRCATPKKVRDFINCALGWLRFIGRLHENPVSVHGYEDEVGEFKTWMGQECGYSEQTVVFTTRVVDRLLVELERREVALCAADIGMIEQILADDQAESRRSAVTSRGYVSRLRTFFRFAQQRGWCASGIAEGLGVPRHYPKQTIPKGPDRDEVSRLVATTQGSGSSAVRDRAILLMLVTYGLRAGEVCALELDDIDWRNDRFRIFCPKTGRNQYYPLSAGVGESVIRYVRDVRFRSPHRQVFLTLRAPCRPLNAKSLNTIVSRRMEKAGIAGRCRGPHSLRHSAAQCLLDRGFSMKAIGDYLGHRSVSATSIYAKVDVATLREVVETDLEILR